MTASITDPRVAAARVEAADGTRYDRTALDAALRTIGETLGWADAASAFGAAVPTGSRVLVKPNWVLHRNHGPGGFEPLVTHGAIIRAVTEAALATGAAAVTVGDAPVQGCDFGALLAASDIPAWAAALAAREPRFGGVVDFRRTVADTAGVVHTQQTDRRGLEHFVLFDIGTESLLEPVTVDGAFRVTMYNPDLMRRTHAPGRHQYLIAREVLEADVIINLPKLKTHKKAGITCALKNLIGINGNKEFLPHHRIGGAAEGGDCYPGQSLVKRSLERVYDVQNRDAGAATRRLAAVAARVLDRTARMGGDELGVEGSWSGNDTIWRTCLDLNRILLYGRVDGSMAEVPQRRVLNVVDAVVAGHGDGPLSPIPLPLGLLLGSASSPAMDWVGGWLLGYRPERLPIARESLGEFRYPLATFGPGDLELLGALGSGPARALAMAAAPADVEHPVGWRDAGATVAAPVG